MFLSSPAFDDYMDAKIRQGEAYMVADGGGLCLGIIAFSKKNNRITFFAVSHRAEFSVAAQALLQHALDELDPSKPVYINEIVSTSEWMDLHATLYRGFGFVFSCDTIESGVPVKTLVKRP